MTNNSAPSSSNASLEQMFEAYHQMASQVEEHRRQAMSPRLVLDTFPASFPRAGVAKSTNAMPMSMVLGPLLSKTTLSTTPFSLMSPSSQPPTLPVGNISSRHSIFQLNL